jgi:hypothetical protein
VNAYDQTYKGKVDLSREVTVGEPEQKSPLQWAVPYNVKDEAGNTAATVWRSIVVEEVNLNDVEAKILSDVQKDQAGAVQRAVDKALKEDLAKRNKVEASPNPRGRKTAYTSGKNCPECPKCECKGNVGFDESFCDAICEKREQTCVRREESAIVAVMLWLEDFFPPTLVPIILFCAIVAGSLLILRWTMTLIFNPQAYQRNQYVNDDRGRDMQDAVTYYNAGSARGFEDAPPPRASLSTRGGATFMTPPQNPAAFGSPTFGSPQAQNGNYSSLSLNQQPRENGLADSIYAAQPIITPSKRGDGVRQRSPYGFRDR